MSVRRVFRDALVYGSGDIVVRASAFLTLPIYSRLLSTSEFGVWSFLVTAGFLLNSALVLGLDSAYGRFYFAERDPERRRMLTSTALLVVTLVGAIVVAVGVPLSPAFSRWAFGSDANAELVALVIVTGPIVAVGSVAGQGLRNEFRAPFFAVTSIVAAVIGTAVALYLVLVEDWAVRGLVVGALVGACVALVLRLWGIRRLLAPRVSRSVARILLVFGVPLVAAAVAGWIFAVSDRFVLAKLSTFHELGLYAVAGSIASVLTVLNEPLGQAWAPHAVSAYERDRDDAAVFYGRVLTYIILGFGMLAVAVAAFSSELVAVLAPKFDAAAAGVAPLALGALFYATTQVTAAGITLSGKTQWIALLTWVAATFNLVLNILLVPSYGMLAAAWVTAASALLLTLLYAGVARRLWPVRYERRRAVAGVGVAAAFVAGALLLPEGPSISSAAWKVLYLCGFVVALAATGAVGARELAATRSLRHRLPTEPA